MNLCNRAREPRVRGRGWYELGMNGSRILVVDDDADVRALVRELLERAGALVREATDGREALRVLYDARPDLIVLDVTMPDIDGWQTLERIRDMTDVPVLMLTARSGELEKVRGLKGGADDYVTKPFGRQELLARCRALLRRAATARPRPAPSPRARPTRTRSCASTCANARVEVGGQESSSPRWSSGC